MCFFGKQKYVAAISCLKRAAYLGEIRYMFPQTCADFAKIAFHVQALEAEADK